MHAATGRRGRSQPPQRGVELARAACRARRRRPACRARGSRPWCDDDSSSRSSSPSSRPRICSRPPPRVAVGGVDERATGVAEGRPAAPERRPRRSRPPQVIVPRASRETRRPRAARDVLRRMAGRGYPPGRQPWTLRRSRHAPRTQPRLLGHWPRPADNLALALEADRLGYAVVWVAEAYGSDAPTVLSLDRRPDRADRPRLGGDADPGPHPGDDGHDGCHARHALRGPVPPRPRGVRARR